MLYRLKIVIFQSTLLQEERRKYPCFLHADNFISIHAPTRGATAKTVSPALTNVISIHAPTRGATLSLFYSYHTSLISIHAPTRGATVVKEVLTLS